METEERTHRDQMWCITRVYEDAIKELLARAKGNAVYDCEYMLNMVNAIKTDVLNRRKKAR